MTEFLGPQQKGATQFSLGQGCLRKKDGVWDSVEAGPRHGGDVGVQQSMETCKDILGDMGVDIRARGGAGAEGRRAGPRQEKKGD